jgi:hypothetical protein
MKDISLEEILKLSFKSNARKMYTAQPCTVLTVYGEGADQKVDIQPSVNTLYKDGEDEEHPPIMGVPVIFPASRTSMLSFPINVGDTVLCVFSQVGIDNFKVGAGLPTKPVDYRRFDKRDAIAIPGLFPFSKALNNPAKRNLAHSTRDAVLTHNIGTSGECEIRLKESGDIQLNTPNNKVIVNCKDAVVNATTVDINASSMTVDVANSTWTGNITHSGDYSQTGNYTLDGIVINTHKHGGIMGGPGYTAVPSN